MLGQFKVIAGDFDNERGAQFANGDFMLYKKGSGIFSLREQVPVSAVESIELATEESVKKMAGAIGWGIVGGLLTGGIGLAAGLLAGGNKKEVVFICKLKDGRKFMGKADSGVYTKIQAAMF